MSPAGEAGGEIRVRVTRVEDGRDLPLPAPATDLSAGVDLRARLDSPLTLDPGERALVPSGIAIELPRGYEAQVRPRTRLALRNGLALVNAPGTVDADYRGEIQVIVINLGREPITLTRGQRIAQLVVQRLPQVHWEEVDSLAASARGAGGFGHTGDR